MTLFGPVFHSDLVVQARRPRTYVIRAAVLSLLLVGFVATYLYNGHHLRRFSTGTAADFGRQLYFTFASIELTLVLLLAPIAAAGALVNDRIRGTLQHTFLTDLSDREIVYGRWASRTLPLLMLVAATFPVLWLCTLLGGISPAEILKLYVVMFGCVLLLTSLCMFFSLTAKRTGDVLIGCYAVTILWSLAPSVQRFSSSRFAAVVAADYWAPFGWVFSVPTGTAPRLTPLIAVALPLLSLALVEWTALRIRAATLYQRTEAKRRSISIRKRLREPNLDLRPVEWLEWARNRSSSAGRLQLLFLYGLAGISLIALAASLNEPAGSRISEWQRIAVLSLAAGFTASLFLAPIGTAAQVTDDRENRHFEMLGLTMLEPNEVLAGRRYASMRHVRIVAVLCSVFAVLCVWRSLLSGLVCGANLIAIYAGFALLFHSGAEWAGLVFRRQLAGLGVTALCCLVLILGGPALFIGSIHRDWTAVAIVQTSPFFSFGFSAVGGVSPEDRERGTEAGSVIWRFAFAGICVLAATLVEARNRRLLGRRMRGEP